jgi:hypothetical protein
VRCDSVQTAGSLPSDFRQNLFEIGQLQYQVDHDVYKQTDSTFKLVRGTVSCKYNHESSHHAGKEHDGLMRSSYLLFVQGTESAHQATVSALSLLTLKVTRLSPPSRPGTIQPRSLNH